MRKLLLKSVLLLCALVAGSTSVWADDFVKVTDASTLADVDVIIIVNETSTNGLSTTQNTNNRGVEGVTVNDYSGIKEITPGSKVQQITLEASTVTISDVVTACWKLKVGTDSYLYAPSSSSNYLKSASSSTAGNNGKATISITSGNATITFRGNSTRNLLKYNSSSSIFSCYASGQQAVQIYKKVAPKITTAEYATYYTPAALDFSTTGIKVYTAKDNGTSVTLNEVEGGQVPANTPVVLYKASADGTPINVPVISTAAAISGTNDLAVSTGTDVANMYVLANGGSGVGFYKWNGASDLSAGKVYLQATSAAREFLGFGDATAIEAVKVQKADGQYFNLAGQRVSHPSDGCSEK